MPGLTFPPVHSHPISQVLSAAGVVEGATIHMVLRPADAPPLPIPGAVPLPGTRPPMGTQAGAPGGQMFNMVFENLGGAGFGGFGIGGHNAAQQQQAAGAAAAGGDTDEARSFAAATMAQVSNAINGMFSQIMGGAVAGTAAGGPPAPPLPLPPHLISTINSYLNRLDDPTFSPPPFPLTSHSLVTNQLPAGSPGFNTSVDAAHVHLTTALQQLLANPTTPLSPALQELLSQSTANPSGRAPPPGLPTPTSAAAINPSAPVPATASATAAVPAATPSVTATATPSAPSPSAAAATATDAAAAGAAAAAAQLTGGAGDLLSSLTALSAALSQQEAQQQAQQQHANTPYAYTSLAVAALSQLLTRSLTHVESTPEVIRLMAQALDAANVTLAQQQHHPDTTVPVATAASTPIPTAATSGNTPMDVSAPSPSITAATPVTAGSSGAAGSSSAPATATGPGAASPAAEGAAAPAPSESDVLAEALQHCASHLSARSALLLELARLSMATSLALAGEEQRGHVCFFA